MTKDIDQKTGQSNGKICPQCGVWKPLDQYKKRKITKKSKSGMNSECKACEKIRNAKYYQENKDRVRERVRVWKADNPEKKTIYDASYRERHPDRVKESAKKWLRTDPLAREKKNVYSKKWKRENPEKVKDITKKASQKRLSVPGVRLNNAIGRAMRSALGKGEKAGRRTFDTLGYTKQELMAHLEALFLPGMTWDNYGLHGWHIDHKIPKSLFHFQTTDDFNFKRCWSLENLQPLWATDNRKKHAKYDPPFEPSLALQCPGNDNSEVLNARSAQ
ncbi:HNH endonuclease [Ochrobactrum sp. MYb29]|nr:HNH endonuclease [Ochrobactrum sp. MYb29]